MSFASHKLVKVLAVIIIVLVVLQYSYTSIFESRWIEPFFLFNSSFLAKHHNYVLGDQLIASVERNSSNSSESQVRINKSFKLSRQQQSWPTSRFRSQCETCLPKIQHSEMNRFFIGNWITRQARSN